MYDELTVEKNTIRAMKDVHQHNTLYKNIIKNIEHAADISDVHVATVEKVKAPKRCIAVSIPVFLDDGTLKIFSGYRVQHNQALGPFKGGIRFHGSVNLSEIISLATLMTLKNALLGLPLGGAKGGVAVDPATLSLRENESLTRQYTKEITPFIGPDKDIPAPDVGTNAQTMAWMLDTYSSQSGFAQTGIVTGKPLAVGGSKGRESATGLGVVLSVQKALETQNKTLINTTLAIQGFGKVGLHVAIEAYRLGAIVVAVSDVSGGLYKPTGLNVAELVHHTSEGKPLSEYTDAEHLSNEELVQLEVDVLALCALDGVIHSRNMEAIRAQIIVEGANGPITSKASNYLTYEKNILIIPDILANGGGVIVSYFEWVQDIVWLFWSEEEVKAKLKTIMFRCFDKVWHFSQTYKIDMRTSALSVSLKRLEEALKLRGQI